MVIKAIAVSLLGFSESFLLFHKKLSILYVLSFDSGQKGQNLLWLFHALLRTYIHISVLCHCRSPRDLCCRWIRHHSFCDLLLLLARHWTLTIWSCSIWGYFFLQFLVFSTIIPDVQKCWCPFFLCHSHVFSLQEYLLVFGVFFCSMLNEFQKVIPGSRICKMVIWKQIWSVQCPGEPAKTLPLHLIFWRTWCLPSQQTICSLRANGNVSLFKWSCSASCGHCKNLRPILFAIFLHSYKEQACFIALTDPVNEAICCHVLLHFY